MSLFYINLASLHYGKSKKLFSEHKKTANVTITIVMMMMTVRRLKAKNRMWKFNYVLSSLIAKKCGKQYDS